MKATAQDWVDTDKYAVKKDIARLGVEAAAEYQMDLIIDRAASGDDRWDGITIEDMTETLEALANE